MVIRAASLPVSFGHLRSAGARGTVLAPFERSAYLEVGGRIVALAASDLGRGPFTITLGGLPSLPHLAGPVVLEHGELSVGPITIDLRGASLWDPTLAPAGAAGLSTALRAAALGELLTGAPEGSISGLLTSARTPLLDALARGLGAIARLMTGGGNSGMALAAVGTEIAGRGPGLTPSGDDLLIGILHAFTVWPHLIPSREGLALGRLLAGVAGSRTTRISAAYLRAAAEGLASEPWHVLVRSLGGSADDLRLAVRRLLRVGETSGADALTGFCWAWHLLASLNESPAT